MSFEGSDGDTYIDEDGHRKRDTSRKRDGKKDKKEKGYTMFEEEDSDGESLVLADDSKSPSKGRGIKAKPFKFPVRKEKGKEKEEKKDAKKEEKGKRREEKEGKKFKKDKKKDKLNLQSPAVTIATTDDNPIFGVPLAVAVERNKSHDGIELPAIVRECVDYIEECGLACEGIYRISGVKSKVQALKDAYNRHQPIYLYEHEPNIVASLLKQFLRDLPEPVLTTSLMPKFEDASTAKSNKKKVELFSKVIGELPACNRLLLSWMIVHMSHVIDLAKENKMTLQNVSIVLSPTMRISHRVLNILFSNTQALFGDVQLRKYVPPLRPAHSKWSLELPDNPASLEEELAKQESLLNQLHTDLHSGLTNPVVEEQLWEVQRVVTQLKRKIKLAKKGTQETEATKPLTEQKRSSNTSLPSLSAPEELRLDLKPAPVADPIPKNTSSLPPPSETVATIEVASKPVLKNIKESKEDTVTLENSRTVKFSGVLEQNTKTQKTEKVNEVEVLSEEKEEKVTKEVKEVGSVKEEGDKTENVVVDTLKENIDIGKGVEGEEEKEGDKEKVKVETEEKEGVCDDEREASNSVQESAEKVETENTIRADERQKSDTDSKQEAVQEKPTTKGEVDENEKKRYDVEKKRVKFEKNEKCEGESQKVESGEEVCGKHEEAEKLKEDENSATSQSEEKDSSHPNPAPVPVPPFMSLTLLEPVKAETPTRKKSLVEEEQPDDESRLEEWKDLEDELLGKKKETKRDDRFSGDEEEDEEDGFSVGRLLEEEYALVMEEEELTAIADELRQKMATERSEMERLAQEIQELHYLRQDSDLEDMSSDSGSSDESEDEEDLQDLVSQLILDNQDLESKNAEMCQKIHEERMICLSVKLQIRLLQQRQLEASCG